MKGRKRITLACNGCRSKRTKCDGIQPKCSACSYREDECHYTDTESKRKRPSNAYIMALEARVELLESRLEAALACSTNSSTDGRREESSSTNFPESQTIVDDLTHAFGCFTLGDTGELRFFGASSNFSIIQNPSLKVASSLEARNRGILAAQQSPGYFEPSEELQDHLLSLFWRWQNSWQYIVSRESFVRDLYVQKSGRYCTPLLLTAIMALASRYSSRLELRMDLADPNTAGTIFARQAKIMLDCEYEAPTTSTVQATAILGLYWASIDNEGLGFMYIGMASRMAMNLGLHSDCSHYVAKSLITQEDVEERSIAFWGIYVLDKLYCLGMGRPASIQECNITTTKPTIKSYSQPDMPEGKRQISTPYDTAHITDNCVHTCELLMITSEVIDKLYAQRSEWTDQEREDRAMQVHLQATRFIDRLPKSLKVSESSLQPSPPFVYQLHLQYHHSIILLHRPFLSQFSVSRRPREYDPNGSDIHSRSCRLAAIKICGILRIYGNNFSNVLSHRFNVHVDEMVTNFSLLIPGNQRYFPVSAVHPAFTAAIILLLDKTMRQEHDSKETTNCLRICLRALYGMNINWNWANRSIRAIHALAAQWKVDLTTLDLEHEVPEENLDHYNRYSSECGGLDQADAPDFQEWSQATPPLSFDEPFEPQNDVRFWLNMALLTGSSVQ